MIFTRAHILALITAASSFFSMSNTIEACSRIVWVNKVNTLSCRTMDLYFEENPMFVKNSRGITRNGQAGDNSIQWTSKYGSIIINAFGSDAASEGMNEKGLAAHVLYLHETKYETRDSRPGLSNTLWVQYIVDNFSTVREAVDAVKSYQVVSTAIGGREWPLHMCIEDSTGDSAIIEFLNGKIVIHHGPQHKVMTNEPPYDIQIDNLKKYRYFGGALPLPGDVDPESRFVRATAFLKTLPEPDTIASALGHALGVMRTVQSPFGAHVTSDSETVDSWPTRWTTAIDLTNSTYYFNSTFTPNIVWVNLKKVDFSPGKTSPSIQLQDSQLIGDITGLL